jgi:hypothetical protein
MREVPLQLALIFRARQRSELAPAFEGEIRNVHDSLSSRVGRVVFGYTPRRSEVIGAFFVLAPCVFGVFAGDLITAVAGFFLAMTAISFILRRQWRPIMLVAVIGYICLAVILIINFTGP